MATLRAATTSQHHTESFSGILVDFVHDLPAGQEKFLGKFFK